MIFQLLALHMWRLGLSRRGEGSPTLQPVSCRGGPGAPDSQPSALPAFISPCSQQQMRVLSGKEQHDVRLTQRSLGLGAAESPRPGLGCPLLCLTLGASRGGWTAQSTGERALALHHLALHSMMWKHHWPPGWDNANSTRWHFLFLFPACFPGRPQETAHMTCLASQSEDGSLDM